MLQLPITFCPFPLLHRVHPLLLSFHPPLVLSSCGVFPSFVSVFPFCLFATYLCCCHIPRLTCSIFFFHSAPSLFHFTDFLPPSSSLFWSAAPARWHFALTLTPLSVCLCVRVCLLCHSAIQLDCDSGFRQIPLTGCITEEVKGACF